MRQRTLFGAVLAALGVCGSVWALPVETQAVSQDGLWRLTAEPFTCTLLLQDALGRQVRRYPWPDLPAAIPANEVLTPVCLQDHPLRRSFVVAFGGAEVLWEISYHPQAEVIYDGLVHDYRLKEGLPRHGFLGVRATRLDLPLDDFWIDRASPHVLGRARWARGEAGGQVQVINLDIRRARARLGVLPTYRLSAAQVLGPADGRVLLLPASDVTPPALPVCVSMTAWQMTPCPEMPLVPSGSLPGKTSRATTGLQ